MQQKKINCPICNDGILHTRWTAKDRWLKLKGEFCIDVCDSCGSAKTSPDADSLKYHTKDYEFYGSSSLFFQFLTNIYFYLHRKAYLTKGRVLDIGCGSGLYLYFLLKHGFEVAGTEPAIYAREEAQKRRIGPVKPYVQDFLPEYENYFDIATLWWTFEHENDPFCMLSYIYLLLKPNGKVIIEVPNFASWERHLFGPLWFHLDVPRHRFHFTDKGIRILLSKAGFSNINIKGVVFDPAYITGSLLFVLEEKMNIDIPNRIKKAIMYLSCCPGLCYGVLSFAVRRSGLMVIEADKKQ